MGGRCARRAAGGGAGDEVLEVPSWQVLPGRRREGVGKNEPGQSSRVEGGPLVSLVFCWVLFGFLGLCLVCFGLLWFPFRPCLLYGEFGHAERAYAEGEQVGMLTQVICLGCR